MEKRSTEYFLNLPAFRDWVKSPDERKDAFWREWIRQNPESLEGFEEAKILLQTINYKENQLTGFEKAAIWQGINQQITGASSRSGSNRNIVEFDFKLLWKAVASIALLIGGLFAYYQFSNPSGNEAPLEARIIEKSVPAGAKKTVQLPDGSMVKLNSGSSIRFPETFAGKERIVVLEGEAYFEVQENPAQPFLVKAGELTVKALGTAFAVLNEATVDSICVSLTEGRVLVSTGSAKKIPSVELEPGEMAAFSSRKKTLYQYPFLDERLLSWIDNTLVFKDADYDQVKQSLEKWYGVEIEAARPMNGWKYTARFKNYSLENILKSICFTNNLNYELDKQKVRFY